jgi:hypothetical protein
MFCNHPGRVLEGKNDHLLIGQHWASLNQSYRPAPIHAVKCVNDVAPVEHRKQMLHGSRRVPLSRLTVFPKDAPGVFEGAQKRLRIFGCIRTKMTGDNNRCAPTAEIGAFLTA